MSIKIIFNQDHKLFKAKAKYELDGQLIVISGINGCGKSQLINAISSVEINYFFERIQYQKSAKDKININVCDTIIDGVQLKRNEILSRSYKDNISLNDISAINVSLMQSSKQTAYNVYKEICKNPRHVIDKLEQGTFQPDCVLSSNEMWMHIKSTTTEDKLYNLTESEFKSKLPDDFMWRKDDSFTDFIGSWFNLFACDRRHSLLILIHSFVCRCHKNIDFAGFLEVSLSYFSF